MPIPVVRASFVDCVRATVRGQNSTSDFAADESRDSKTQVELVHGTCWPRPREAASPVRRRCHSYYDISARVCVQVCRLLHIMTLGKWFTHRQGGILSELLRAGLCDTMFTVSSTLM